MARKPGSSDGVDTTEADPDLAVFARTPIFPPVRVQRVLDAVAVLHSERTKLAAALSRGPVPRTRIVGRGAVEINRWLWEAVRDWHDVLSVRPWGRVEELRVSLPRNRDFVAGANHMISVFDYYGTTPQARLLLGAEKSSDYLFSNAPVQLKIINKTQVLLDGPVLGGEPTVMVTAQPSCMAAAAAYWRAVLDCSFPCAEAPECVPDLTDRQRQVVAALRRRQRRADRRGDRGERPHRQGRDRPRHGDARGAVPVLARVGRQRPTPHLTTTVHFASPLRQSTSPVHFDGSPQVARATCRRGT